MMTKRDYEAIASILDQYAQGPPPEAWLVRRIAYDLAQQFAEDNPRFNRERFIRAAGVAVMG